MFRIAISGIANKRILHRCSFSGRHCAPLTQTVHVHSYPPQAREPCPPPPPDKLPPPKNDAWIWGTLTVVILGAGFAVYAKSNAELRDWLTINAPWMDDFIAVLHQENMTYQEFAKEFLRNSQTALVSFFSDESKTCTETGKPLPAVQIAEETVVKCTDLGTEGDYVIIDFSDVDDEDGIGASKTKNSATLRTQLLKTIAKATIGEIEEVEKECVKLAAPVFTQDICEFESCLKSLGDDALFNYMTARDACICYNKLVEDAMKNFTMNKLKDLHEALEERKQIVKIYVGQGKCSVARLDELSRYIDCGLQAPKDVIKNTKDLLSEYQSKIKTVELQWLWENDRSIAFDDNWMMVEELVSKYTNETKMMTRNLDYSSDKPQLTGDPDLILHHTLRYVDDLKVKLSEASEAMTDRVNRAYESLILTKPDGKPVDEKKRREIESNLKAEYKKRLANIEADIAQRASNKKTENNNIYKESLKNQQEQFKNDLIRKLEEKETESQNKLDKMVIAQAALERKEMAKQKADMACKLKLVEDKLEAHLKVEMESRRSQDLWVAGYSLLAATKKGDPCVNVEKEIKAIERASGDSDKLVQSVLKAIPECVRKHGVVPECVVRENYRAMEDVAMKVALVEQEGAPLPVYILSFVQSMFLFMRLSGIPQKEYDDPPKKPSEDLDTFDLLQRARFWIDRGDIARALTYVESLEGASRAAAETWRRAARAHIETRQAAQAILAHAAALALQYV